MMGLDVSHNAWSGPYSQFMQWREWLAQQVGIPLLAMENFTSAGFSMEQQDRLPRQAMCRPIPWSILKHDPLHVLLNHSDCDGIIECGDLVPLERRLREVAESCEDVSGKAPGHARGCYDSMRMATLRFADGCRAAIKAGDNLEFH